jgi:TusA-related sulfurtransferase
MTEKNILDVRGLSCPEPAMLTREALAAQKEGALVVLTDSSTFRGNIERTGKLAGWKVETSQDADQTYRITLTK